MEQCYQPDAGEVTQGAGAEASEAEILAAVRSVLTAEAVSHPEVEQAAAGGRRFWRVAPKPERPVESPVGSPAESSLVSRFLGRFRG